MTHVGGYVKPWGGRSPPLPKCGGCEKVKEKLNYPTANIRTTRKSTRLSSPLCPVAAEPWGSPTEYRTFVSELLS